MGMSKNKQKYNCVGPYGACWTQVHFLDAVGLLTLQWATVYIETTSELGSVYPPKHYPFHQSSPKSVSCCKRTDLGSKVTPQLRPPFDCLNLEGGLSCEVSFSNTAQRTLFQVKTLHLLDVRFSLHLQFPLFIFDLSLHLFPHLLDFLVFFLPREGSSISVLQFAVTCKMLYVAVG